MQEKIKRGYEAMHKYTGGMALFQGEQLPSWESLTRLQRDALTVAFEAAFAEPPAPEAPAEPKSKKGA